MTEITTSPATSDRLPYLPALDGLRAVAVTAVVLYHLDLGWARGGFLGVDLFFVISGFLITTLMLREHAATGRIALGSFWIRRFKRLVPPFIVMVVATVVATRLWGVPEQWASVRRDAVAALSYVGNWRFVFAEQSYFDTLLGPSPLLHTWSLAVEEQWYLLWPLAMVGLVALARRRMGGIAIGSIVLATVASAVWMAVRFDAADPSRVYFGTDTRAQQLLVGAALGWLTQRRPRLLRTGARNFGAATVATGLAAFLAIASTTDDDSRWLYTGGFLLISMLCAVLVLGTATDRPAAPLRWLGSPMLVWIGLRSYGIYLWHWPVIIFVGQPMGLDLARVPLMVFQVALTVLLAELSHRLVERPIRAARWRPATVAGIWSAATIGTIAATVLVLPLGAGLTQGTDLLVAASPRSREITSGVGPTRPDPQGAVPASPDDVDDGEIVPEPPAELPVDPTSLLLIGDSTAIVLAKNHTFDEASHIELSAHATLGCGIFDDLTIDSDAEFANLRSVACTEWRSAWQGAVETVDPDLTIVMLGAWEVLDQQIDGVDYRFPSDEWFTLVRRQFTDAVAIVAADQAPVVVLSVPCMQESADDDTTARTDPARVAAVNSIIVEVVDAEPLASLGDLGSLLCPDGLPLDEVDGERVRYDGVHLSTPGSDLVWRWLRPQISGALS